MTMKPVLHSFAYCLDFLREQVADVAAADMVAQPNGIMNHPAWVIGHLTYTCQLLGGAIGLPEWLPNDFDKRFGTGSVPVADAGLYETKDNALAMLRDAQSRIAYAVDRLDDSRLDEPFPAESYRDVFPIDSPLANASACRAYGVSHWTTYNLAQGDGLAINGKVV